MWPFNTSVRCNSIECHVPTLRCRWINRLARWGAGLSNVFGRPDALGPERWTPDSVKVQGAAPEMLEQDVEDSLTEEEEGVVAEVDGGLTQVLTVGISTVPIFARMVEAMCWEFSAAELTKFLTAHQFQSYTLGETSFNQLCVLANHAVVTYAARDDYSSLRQLLDVAVRLHALTDNGQQRMMISMLSKHAFWHNTGVWSGIFYGKTLQLQK